MFRATKLLFAISFVVHITLTTFTTTTSVGNNNGNYIINGNFENPSVGSGWGIFHNVVGWSGSLEIGSGKIYNSGWNSQVCELDGDANVKITQQVNLPKKGNYLLKFQYAARAGSHIQTSQMNVYWNNVLIAKINPSNFNIVSHQSVVNGEIGSNSVSFQGSGKSDSLGITIDNVELYESADSQPSNSNNNLIVNGNFETPFVTNKQGFSTFDQVPGWSGRIEIGNGKIYNLAWNSQVAELDTHQNIKITQKINVNTAGYYLLEYDYAARQGPHINTSQMNVYLNGLIIDRVAPRDFQLVTKDFIVYLQAGQNQISFEGTGASDAFGITIDNVKLSFYSSTSTNYIINGGFQVPQITNIHKWQHFLYNIFGWQSQKNIEVGLGTFYNKNWNSQVCELDSDQNIKLSQNVVLTKLGNYLLKYQYAARENAHIKLDSSQMNVYWNGVIIAKILPTDYNIVTGQIVVSAQYVVNTITFEAAGNADHYGMTIDNVELYDSPDSQPSNINSNLIINGGFESPFVTNQQGFSTFDQVPGWSGRIEIGNGKIYNLAWNSQVAELDTHQNIKITQKINVNTAGYYLLEYDYAARQGPHINTSQMNVYLNGLIIDRVAPRDFQLVTKDFIVYLQAGQNQISFEGTGASDAFGITIDNVKLSFYSSTSTNYIINGGFQVPQITNIHKWQHFLYNIFGWQSQKNIEVGLGTFYNKNWNSQVCELDSDQNIKLSQNVVLTKLGNYLLKYQYAARENAHIKLDSSQMNVYWNGVIIAKILPTDYNIVTGQIVVSAQYVVNTITFEAAGNADHYGMTIDNVELYDSPDSQPSNINSNLIINGGFESPFVTNQQGFSTFDQVPGWSGRIEIGNGKIYNLAWNSQVAELDTHQNIKITQKINVNTAGYYLLEYDYAARQGPHINTSQMNVYLNGLIIDRVAPRDFQLVTKDFIVYLQAGQNQISFEGTGASDAFGITIDNVKLSFYSSTSTNYIINGGFQVPQITNIHKWQHFLYNIFGWQSQKNIEVGLGTFYNKNWNSQVCELDSDQNIKLSQNVVLTKLGNYLLKYQYAARENAHIKLDSSQMNVYWNGVIIAKILPTDYNIVTGQIVVSTQYVVNTITFEAAGNADHYGMTIDNVELYEYTQPQNGHYCINGDFESFGGWKGKVQIVDGKNQNSQWSTKVAKINNGKDNRLKQQILLDKEGKFILKYNYAANPKYQLKESDIKVYWNSALINHLISTTYDTYYSVEIVYGLVGINTVEFEGNSPTQNYGMTIDDVQVEELQYSDICNK